MTAELGCYARLGHECRGCGGWYPKVDRAKIESMAALYRRNGSGLVRKDTGEAFPLCGPIEAQVAALIPPETL